MLIYPFLYILYEAFNLSPDFARIFVKSFAFVKHINFTIKGHTVTLSKNNKILKMHFEELYDIFLYVAGFEIRLKNSELVVLPKKFHNIEAYDFSKPNLHILRQTRVPMYIYPSTEGEGPNYGYLSDYIPKKGDVVFDCGAYCGVSTYFFSKLVGKQGKVIAFEPDDFNYEVLKKNVRYHKLKNVIPVKMGLWSASTELEFTNTNVSNQQLQYRDANSFLVLPCVSANSAKRVKVLSLKDAYRKFKLKRLDFVKMDIEGSEIDTIRGSADFIKNNDIHFAIASYHRINGEMTYKKLEQIFYDINYDARTGYPYHLTTWASKRPKSIQL
jgi:FkbM family methyltransferase